ncbi:MAG: hypothetical protein M3178_04275 [Pseudomonadota bacterium]|nr:hypothetical protein [Pseudomonadota bacterium]
MRVVDAMVYFAENIVYAIVVLAGLWFLAKKADESDTLKSFSKWVDRLSETRPLLARLISYGSVIIVLMIIGLVFFHGKGSDHDWED